MYVCHVHLADTRRNETTVLLQTEILSQSLAKIVPLENTRISMHRQIAKYVMGYCKLEQKYPASNAFEANLQLKIDALSAHRENSKITILL